MPAEQRIDFVSVCTPNHTHFEIAKAAAEAIAAIQDETNRLAVDPVRDGAKELVNALMTP